MAMGWACASASAAPEPAFSLSLRNENVFEEISFCLINVVSFVINVGLMTNVWGARLMLSWFTVD